MRRALLRCIASSLLAVSLVRLASLSALAAPPASPSGSIEIRLIGANGLRDFIALSPEDRRGATALMNQVAGAMEGPAQPIEEAAATLPHYRIVVRRLAPSYFVNPWPRPTQTSFIYYPGGVGTSFLMVAFSQSDATLEQRWMLPSTEVSALLERHLKGLPPIASELPDATNSAAPWGMAIGVILLAALGALLLEDRRRWPLAAQKRSAGKGT